jgi:hypothetical protein
VALIRKSSRWRAIVVLALAAAAVEPTFAAEGVALPATDRGLLEVAQEARQTIAVIEWFYLRNGACPQTSRPAEIAALQEGLGDGFSVDTEGQFAAIRGISMSAVWFYYASPLHRDRCTVWRKLDRDSALIWRRRRSGGQWSFNAGDGSAERSIKVER